MQNDIRKQQMKELYKVLYETYKIKPPTTSTGLQVIDQMFTKFDFANLQKVLIQAIEIGKTPRNLFEAVKMLIEIERTFKPSLPAKTKTLTNTDGFPPDYIKLILDDKDNKPTAYAIIKIKDLYFRIYKDRKLTRTDQEIKEFINQPRDIQKEMHIEENRKAFNYIEIPTSELLSFLLNE